MELLLTVGSVLLSIIVVIVNTLLNWFLPKQKPSYPPIRNEILTKSVGELIIEIRNRKLTSENLVEAYIARIREVNPSLNAVIEERFAEARKEAQHADQLISKTPDDQLSVLFARYPLLGIPFTVKESCGLKGMSYAVGSIERKYERCQNDGEVVESLRSAGCIPLLVSATPEFCLSFETNTPANGKCRNPYDLKRSSGGSSGGEAALNGAGATPFGVGSDIAGSIRLPSMFCGIYGHKPTGGLLSVREHFPYSSKDPDFPIYLQPGPMTRFARDLPVLLQIMAGKNSDKLKFNEGIQTKDIKIYYSYGFDGFNSFRHPIMDFDVKLAIIRAVKCFENGGLSTKEVQIKGFSNSLEITLASLLTVEGIPSVVTQSHISRPSVRLLFFEFIRGLIGHSLFSKEAIILELARDSKILFSGESLKKWKEEVKAVKKELIDLLGDNGVLFFPTFHTTATCFNTSILNLVGIDMMLLFNILGLPATQVPLGVDRNGMPVGLQIVGAPYQDKLCIQIAMELEGAFGGWQPVQKHELS